MADFNGGWIKFYSEFADVLLKYRNNRNELIRIIKKVFESIDMKLPTLEKDNLIVDIDPFTVFGLFNKGISDLNRKKIIKGMYTLFLRRINLIICLKSLKYSVWDLILL